MTGRGKRWLKFNLVGAVGFGVQIGMLTLLVSGLCVNYLVATALAVETAVLHNFIWHERYTWKGQGSTEVRAIAVRLLRFHVSNGLVSLIGNLALMRLFVGWLHVQYVVANIVTIFLCGLLNFALSEWFVFR